MQNSTTQQLERPKKFSKRRIPPPPADELRELYETLSLQEMADHYQKKLERNISVTTVGNWLDAAGIEKRSRGGVVGRFKVADVKTEDVVTAYEEQITTDGRPNYAALSRQFNMSTPAIYYRLESAGIEPMEVKIELSDEQKEEVIRRYPAGDTLDKLAAAFDVASSTIYRTLVDAGVEIRGSTDHMVNLWSERKLKLQQAERHQNIEGLDVKTGLRVSLAACLLLKGLNPYAMRLDVFPDAKVPADNIKKLFANQSEEIKAEKHRLAKRTDQERGTEEEMYRSRLKAS